MGGRAARQPAGHRGADLLRAGGESDGAAHGQDLRGAAAARSGFSSRCGREVSGSSGPCALHHSRLRPSAARAARRSKPRGVTPTIAPSAPHALHMPSHTFTRVGYLAGVGRRPTSTRSRPRCSTAWSAKRCTRWTIRPTRICRWPRTVPARDVLDSIAARRGDVRSSERRGRRGAADGGLLCARRDSRALRARARRVGGSGAACRCPRPARRSRSRSPISLARSAPRAADDRPRRDGDVARLAALRDQLKGQGRVLGRAGRHSVASSRRVDRVLARTAG